MSLFAGRDLVCVRSGRLVFRGVGFALESGGALLLTGPNGSGKSSLLRLMAGLLPAAGGRLEWRGAPVGEAGMPEALYVGHLDAVKPVLTVAEHLSFWASLDDGGEGDDVAARVRTALDGFGLGGLAGLPGRVLSAGQRRRLNLARLVVARAALWLLDEPTVSLDRAGIAQLEAAIARHRAAGGAVVASTHADLAMPGADLLVLGGRA